MPTPEFDGRLIIFSAPSGSGKTTIVKHLLANYNHFGFSISACTRDKRGRNEEQGKDYYFMTPDEFREHIEAGDFVEWEEVYTGAFYGTLKSEIERNWEHKKHVLFDVDVRGGLSLKKYYGDKALAIFVKAPSLEVIESRLRSRGTESEDAISKRLFKVKFETSFMEQFDMVVLNDDLQATLQEVQTIIENWLAKPVA